MNRDLVMKVNRQNLFQLLALFIAANLFVACDNEQTAYLDEDTNLQDTKVHSESAASFSQIDNTDYEIIPIGTNNYVYVPRMTSAKVVARSTETSKMYSATIEGEAYSYIVGKLYVTITWNDQMATYSISDGYTHAHQSFTYHINGSSIDVQLSFRVYKGGAYFGDFNYSGTLSGS